MNTIKFFIYFFLQANPSPHGYQYDSTWMNFLHHQKLETPYFLTENDIECYDWKQQRLFLTKNGIQKFIDLIAKENILITGGRVKFIVTLNNQRLYAGAILYDYSAMAVKVPVIYFDHINKVDKFIDISPVHGMMEQPPIELKNRIAIPTVKKYFEEIGKLKK